MRNVGQKHARKGPKIHREGRYDSLFSFQWPVFPVELTDDPERIRKAWDATLYYAGDPSTESHESELRRAAGGHNVRFKPKTPLELVKGPYLIPTKSKPLSTNSPLSMQPRPLDQVRSMHVGEDDDVLDFVKRFGFLGSTRRRNHPSAYHGEALKHIRADLYRALELVEHWKDFVAQDRDREAPLWDERAVIPRLNHVLMEGTGPAVRISQPPTEESSAAFTTGFTCRTLYHALFLQFYLDLAGARESDICHGCGDVFGAKHGNQKYCSRSCGDAARHREAYKAQIKT